jgi:hypothetical protein
LIIVNINNPKNLFDHKNIKLTYICMIIFELKFKRVILFGNIQKFFQPHDMRVRFLLAFLITLCYIVNKLNKLIFQLMLKIY